MSRRHPGQQAQSQSGHSRRGAPGDATRAMLVPLRAFLGFTFCFAGLQKLANPGFFRAADPGSIQSQLAGALRRSPVHALIAPLVHVAVPLGLVIAFAELAVGIGTLLGLWQRAAAAGGILLSLMLYLTVSFHSSPYYTGADIVFVFAWTPLLLAGAGSMLSVDAALASRTAAPGQPLPSQSAARQDAASGEITRKGALTMLVAAGGLVLGGLTAGLGRLVGGTEGGSGRAALSPRVLPTSSPGTRSPGARAPLPAGTGKAGGNHPAGQAIGPAGDVPVGGAAAFTDPGTGNPSIVLQPNVGEFHAFDAVCPHAGCTVGYSRAANLLICPCHGSEFNPSTGAVEAGPAPTGLTPLQVTKSNGQLYVRG